MLMNSLAPSSCCVCHAYMRNKECVDEEGVSKKPSQSSNLPIEGETRESQQHLGVVARRLAVWPGYPQQFETKLDFKC